MDYLKAFTIGTSGLVTLPHFAQFVLDKDRYKDYPFKIYSIVAPIYYGLMTMLALYLGSTFDWSLQKRLFITSIISLIFVFLLTYFIVKKKWEPYKSYTRKEWIYYFIRNGLKHLFVFNIIIFYFEKYFSKSNLLKAYIIGSSIFSYWFNFLVVIDRDNKGLIKFDYPTFAIWLPYDQAKNVIIGTVIFPKIFNISLRTSFFLGSLIVPISWLIWMQTSGEKHYNIDKKTLGVHFLYKLIYDSIRYNIILYYLFTNLK